MTKKSKSQIGRRSKEKGKEGELEIVHMLEKFGFKAMRGQQHKGTSDSPDIIHDMEGFFLEVKRRQALNLYDTLDKADTEKPDDATSIVFHRKDRHRWLVTLDAEEFLSIAQELFE